GAGPGAPDLITVRGYKAILEADLLVVAGSLVSEAVYQDRSPACRVVDSAPLNLEQITSLLIAGWQQNLKTVRLHTGDPTLYGAIQEQMAVLAQSGVPCRIIPGVTSSLAAAAVLGLEWTLPEVTQTLILTRAPGRTPMPPGEDLASLCAHRSSLALYLSAAQGEAVSRILAEHYGPQSPVALCYRVTWPDERIIWTTAEDLPRTLAAEKLERHTLMLIGPAVSALKNGTSIPKSRLYDPAFSHLCREGSR
ncbi:MAG: precorrin-4 C(11)-methyltransferase, partial [Deltaproteobacteria bacterium]|nr:precorrin-4 C(11)-methyltransferase [Deltaproteobacteria bacterium]